MKLELKGCQAEPRAVGTAAGEAGQHAQCVCLDLAATGLTAQERAVKPERKETAGLG